MSSGPVRSQRRQIYNHKTITKSVTLPIPLVERAVRQAFREGHRNFSILTAKAITAYLEVAEAPNDTDDEEEAA
jgi:hypothetical protein